MFYVFDVLHLGERSLLAETYDGRRTVLAELELGSDGSDVVPPAHVDVAPAQLLEVARAHGLEGIVCKRRRSRYDPGRRSPPWIKTALLTTQEVLIGGWTPGKGRRAGTVRALLLGAPAADGDLIFLGSVGTGFTAAALGHLHQLLDPLGQDGSPFRRAGPGRRGAYRLLGAPRTSRRGRLPHPDRRLSAATRSLARAGARPGRQPEVVLAARDGEHHILHAR